MKRIPKTSFDALLSITRKFHKTGERDLIQAKIALSEQLQKETGVDWLAFFEFADCIFKYHGFKPNASNATIYAVLNSLGYEVVDNEIQESESL